MNYTFAKIHKPKSGNDWYVYYTFRNPETGKMALWKERAGINRLSTVKEKHARGAKMVANVNKRLEDGWSPYAEGKEIDTRKIDEVFDDILTIKKPGLRPRTVEHYKHAVDLFKEFLAGKKIMPNQFTAKMAQDYSDWLLTSKKYTSKSHNNKLSDANIFFNAMVDREIIDKNPFKKIRKKPVEEGKLISYSNEQKKLIRDYTKKNGHPMYYFIQWIYYCFIRPYELMQLQVKHIDFENATIQIPAYASKNRKHGIVPINEVFMKEVVNKYKGKDSELYLFGFGLEPNLKPVHRNRSSHSFKELRETLNIPKDHLLYDWKNTGARDFILSGKNPYLLMAYMRHHSLDQTMVYMRSLGVTTGMKINKNAWKF